MKYPRKRKIRSAEKLASAFFNDMIPVNGITTSVSNAGTGSGIASVIHKTPIHSARPQTLQACSVIPSGTGSQ